MKTSLVNAFPSKRRGLNKYGFQSARELQLLSRLSQAAPFLPIAGTERQA